MTKPNPKDRLSTEEIKENMDGFDDDVLCIPPIPTVVHTALNTVNNIIALLEANREHASATNRAALKRALGCKHTSGCKHAELTEQQMKKPLTLYSLRKKIMQASDEQWEDFQFAREIM